MNVRRCDGVSTCFASSSHILSLGASTLATRFDGMSRRTLMTDEEFWPAIELIREHRGTHDVIAAALGHAEAVAARAKAMQKALDDALLGHVQKHGPLMIGHMMYHAGYSTK